MLRTLTVAATLGIFSASALIAQEISSAPADSAAVAAKIQPQYEAWLDAYERGDVDALAALFAEEGIYAANTGEVLRGRVGIREGVRAWLPRRPAGVTLDVQRDPLRFRLAGDAAYDLARFTIRAAPPGCIIDAGHALSVWRE